MSNRFCACLPKDTQQSLRNPLGRATIRAMIDSIRNREREFVRHSDLFRGLSDDELETVIAAARAVEVAKGSFFFHQGEMALSFYVVSAGQVRLSQINPDGQQVIVHIFGPGDAMGIIVALSNTSYPVSAEAMSKASALGWDLDTITELMESIPRLAINGLRLLSLRFLELQQRYRELATERVEQRLARALLREFQRRNIGNERGNIWNIPLTRQDLAEMTGTTLYTVSRICSSWEHDSLLVTGRGFVEITDLHGLIIIAEDLPDNHCCPGPHKCIYCIAQYNCQSE